MKIAVISANLGNFDPTFDHVLQSVPCDVYYLTDKDYPLRSNAMTPRLQARIVKMFMHQMIPGYDYYLWVDRSCILSNTHSVKWFLDQLGDNDIVVFKHPNRNTIQEEADYLNKRLSIKCGYITPRYENELIDEQLKAVDPEAQLYASTAFIYKNSPAVQATMKEWWFHTSRYHSIDQLSFPFVIKDLKIKVIPDSYMKIPYLEYTRKKK